MSTATVRGIACTSEDAEHRDQCGVRLPVSTATVCGVASFSESLKETACPAALATTSSLSGCLA